MVLETIALPTELFSYIYMNYYIYFLEIKNRIFLLLLTWVSSFIICYCYKEVIFFLILSLTQYISLNSYYEMNFIFTNVTEIFYVYIKLIIFIANQTLLFALFYHLLMFLSSGLYKSEYENLKFFIKIFIMSFFVSFLFLNILLMPFTWDFFLKFQNQDLKLIPFFFEAKLDEYLSYYISLYYLCLINAQISIFLLAIISYYSKNNFVIIKNLRKFFYFVFVIISTLTTPPDIVSQLVLSLILILIYEVTIFLELLKKFFFNKVTN